MWECPAEGEENDCKRFVVIASREIKSGEKLVPAWSMLIRWNAAAADRVGGWLSADRKQAEHDEAGRERYLPLEKTAPEPRFQLIDHSEPFDSEADDDDFEEKGARTRGRRARKDTPSAPSVLPSSTTT